MKDHSAHGTAAPSAAPADRKIKYYRHPMGLPDISPSPKKDSMGMDYIPVYEGEDSDDGSVKLSPGKIQRTGVKSEPAASRVIRTTVPRRANSARRAPRLRHFDAGRELHPENRRCHHRKPRRQGRAVDGSLQPGHLVGRGRICFDDHSSHKRRRGLWQRLAATPDESRRTRSGDSGDGEKPDGSHCSGVDIATRRHRARANAIEGARAQPGDVLFRIADHTLVWAIIDVAERDMGMLAVGQPATVNARGFPGRTFTGKST